MHSGGRVGIIVGASWVLAVVLAASTASAQVQVTASADVRDRLSRFIGNVSFTQEEGGVHLTGILRNLPAGPHAIHIMNVGKCLSPSFLSAGTIFNPTGKKHGLLNPDGPQIGDLPSLAVSAQGIASLDVAVRGATLSSGPTSLIGGNGTALVIHVGDDDQRTDPEGNAGERLACGTILATEPTSVSPTAQSPAAAAVAAQSPAAAAVAPSPVTVVSAPTSPAIAQAARQPTAVLAQPTAAVQQPTSPSARVSSDTGGVSPLSLIAGIGGLLLLTVGFMLRRGRHHRSGSPFSD